MPGHGDAVNRAESSIGPCPNRNLRRLAVTRYSDSVSYDQNMLTSKSWFLSLQVLLFSLLLAAPGWSQPRHPLPSWARNEPAMPFLEYSKWQGIRSWLADARVIHTAHTPREATVWVAVEHMYAGPSYLEGRVIDLRFTKDFSHAKFYELEYLDAFSQGQRLLLSLRWFNHNDNPYDENAGEDGTLNHWRSYGLGIPTALDDSPQSRLMEEHARRVEKVYRAPAEARKEMMKEYAQSNLPYTSPWAISSIAFWRNAEGTAFLKALAKEPGHSVAQLIGIDALLSDGWKSNDWTGSPERDALLMSLAAGPHPEADGTRVLEALDSMQWSSGRGVITKPRYRFYWSSFMANPTIPPETKWIAISRMDKIVRNSSLPKAEALEFWLPLLEKSSDADVIASAARSVLSHAPWSTEEKARIAAALTVLKGRIPRPSPQQDPKLALALTNLAEASKP